MASELCAIVAALAAVWFFVLWVSARVDLVREKEEKVSILTELRRHAEQKRHSRSS